MIADIQDFKHWIGVLICAGCTSNNCKDFLMLSVLIKLSCTIRQVSVAGHLVKLGERFMMDGNLEL